MPWKYRKGKGKRPHKIVDAHGRVVGSSTTAARAKASIKARYANYRKK